VGLGPGGGAPGATAELLADHGKAAASANDFFRSPQFLAAEGATDTLRISSPDRTALIPLVVREIPGSELRDATSPYGYPGGTVEGDGAAPRSAEVDWSATALVSVFGRERLAAEPWLAGAAERSGVLVHDPARPRRVRARLAEQIRANARDGWGTEVAQRPTVDDVDSFALAYEQTMRRAGAAERYFFARSYFDAALAFERSWLVVARRSGEFGAGAIAAVSDSVLHYFLGATLNDARRASPFKNVVAAMLDLADELRLPLNLGGGVAPGDGLEEFKRGFANSAMSWRTQEVVCDPTEYDRLAPADAPAGFFPAYRAPS
jgi:hypothetical protein